MLGYNFGPNLSGTVNVLCLLLTVHEIGRQKPGHRHVSQRTSISRIAELIAAGRVGEAESVAVA